MKKQIFKQKSKILKGISALLTIVLIIAIFFTVNQNRYIKHPLSKTNFDTKNWMQLVADETELKNINIPGSHDAAAINLHYKDMYARHFTTITDQLNSGIRLLDIRLQFKKNKENKFDFLTCHGNIGSALSLNTYQSFASLLQECDAFLDVNPSETILMSLKIDDNRLDSDAEKQEAFQELKELLSVSKIRPYQQELGTLKEARGQIILFNRMNNDTDFGYPMPWKDNVKGITVAEDTVPEKKRSFSIGAQDYYSVGFNPFVANQIKANTFLEATKAYKAGDTDVLFNFASACTLAVFAISPYEKIAEDLGKLKAEKRPDTLGWVLMDYEDQSYKTDAYGYLNFVNLIIDSNFSYSSYPKAFQIQ